MDTIIKLQEQLERLKEYLDTASKRMENAPEGSLVIKKANTYPELYQCISNKSEHQLIQRYLHKDDMQLTSLLAQKSYDRAAIRKAMEQINVSLQFPADGGENLAGKRLAENQQHEQVYAKEQYY